MKISNVAHKMFRVEGGESKRKRKVKREEKRREREGSRERTETQMKSCLEYKSQLSSDCSLQGFFHQEHLSSRAQGQERKTG